MMEPLTTYTVKSRQDAFVMVFKYHLNGDLFSYQLLEGGLSDKQKLWLFRASFPYEEKMIEFWQKKYRSNFEITKGESAITFDAFWEAYGLKTRKKETQDFWKKMSEADRFKAIAGIRKYLNHLRLYAWKNQMDPIRYLKHRRYEDEF